MARNTLQMKFDGFAEMLVKLESVNGDIKSTVSKELEKAGKQIGTDTQAALTAGNLPAGGKYSQGDTAEAVVMSPKTNWSGMLAEIDIGFDFGKKGAGGFLISGTPKMRPDAALNRMYVGRAYMRKLQKMMMDDVAKMIDGKMSGGGG